MPGVTDMVRRALEQLGPEATLREVTDLVMREDATVRKNYISLALRKLRIRAAEGRDKAKK